jgi:hypothetical protein
LRITITLVFLFVFSTVAVAQQKASTFQLGRQTIVIPVPMGFEDAASQFESVRTRFATTEAPGNDMLTVHLPHEHCDKLREGEQAAFNFYTKVSVAKRLRDIDYSSEQFADLISTFRKDSAIILDPKSPNFKATVENVNKALTTINKQDTRVDFSQPLNLGEFDTRPNVYSIMLLINLKTQNRDGETNTFLAGGLSYVRIKQRLVFVYTYRKYDSAADVQILRDFTREWMGQILAAN